MSYDIDEASANKQSDNYAVTPCLTCNTNHEP
jgi:hypothetical protein